MIDSWIESNLFDEISQIAGVIDREYRIVKANRRFTEAFGEWQGRRCYDVLLGRSARCRGCEVAKCFVDGLSRSTSVDWMGPSKHYQHFVLRLVPIPDGTDAGTVGHTLVMATDITSSERLNREHQILFERVPCYVAVLDRRLRIVRANQLLRETFGEHIGELCHEVFKQRQSRCPDCPALRSFEDGKVHTARSVGHRLNGDIAHYVVTTAPLVWHDEPIEYIIEILHDVTDLQRLQDELKREQQFLSSTIDQSFDGVVATDAELRITGLNPAAESLLGITADEVRGSPEVERVYPAEFLDILRAGGGSCVLPETTIRVRKEEVPIRFAGVIVRDRDEVLGTAGFLQDLREVKRLQREMLDAERLAAVGQTVAGLAHGVKNILTGLEGGLFMVRWGLEDDRLDKIQKGWEMLDRNFERITTFVREFLNFAKGRVPTVQPIDPNQVAGEVVELFSAAAHDKGVTIAAELQVGIAKANLDLEGIHKALSNLVSNAIDACLLSEEGDCRVVVRTRDRDGRLEYEVEDNGCGMDCEIKRKVFTSFFTTKGTRGTGLGLLETKKVVQEHGGSVDIESAPGVGSTVRLLLPRARLPRPESAPSDSMGQGGAR